MEERRGGKVDLTGLDMAERISLCETLDRILNKGAVVAGEVAISVADVDLLYLGLQVVLTSVETARQGIRGAAVVAVGEESIDAGARND